MLERYLVDNFELPLDERAGYQFIQLALKLSPLLAKANHFKNTPKKEKVKALEEALRKIGDVWVASAKEQPKFSIPEGRKKDYFHSKYQHDYIKANKDAYIEREKHKQDELRIVEQDLTEEINIKKIELARMEDDYRHQVNAAKNHEQTKKKGCFPSLRKKKNQEPELTADELKKRGSQDVRRKRKYLTMLRNYRWYIKNQIEQPIENYHDQHIKWKHEVESYRLNMRINQLYLKNAIYRHYASEPENVISRLFYLYYIIKDLDAILIDKSPELQNLLDELAAVADTLYLAKAADRTIESFYKYLVQHYEPETRARLMQVVQQESRLPEVFLASFENSNSPLNQLISKQSATSQLQMLSGTPNESNNKKASIKK